MGCWAAAGCIDTELSLSKLSAVGQRRAKLRPDLKGRFFRELQFGPGSRTSENAAKCDSNLRCLLKTGLGLSLAQFGKIAAALGGRRAQHHIAVAPEALVGKCCNLKGGLLGRLHKLITSHFGHFNGTLNARRGYDCNVAISRCRA